MSTEKDELACIHNILGWLLVVVLCVGTIVVYEVYTIRTIIEKKIKDN